MKSFKQSSIFTGIFIAAIIFNFISPVAAQSVKQTKPVVMVLGAYHMGNPGLDLNNVKADDVRTEKRQKEIADFLNILKKFKPTKIAVEAEPENNRVAENYQKYLKGEYELKSDEVDQIAFRMAKELSQPQIFQIDRKGDFDFDKVLASAKANNQMPFAEQMLATGKAETEKMNELLKKSTVTEMFAYLNDAGRVNEWHQPYLKFAHIGSNQEYAGADLTGDWYRRNLRIYANLTRITESPNDRILVIFGAGHLKLLQQFVEESGEYDLERLNKYL